MLNNVCFQDAKKAIIEFFNNEINCINYDDVMKFSNLFYRLSNYEEEGKKIRPSLFISTHINALQKTIPSCERVTMHTDDDFVNFRQRIKSLSCFCTKEWDVYINVEQDKVEYGIIKAVNSIKDKSLKQLVFEDYAEVLSKKTDLININVISGGLVFLKGIKGHKTSICFNLNENVEFHWEDNIQSFVSACVSKIKTTKRKLTDIKNIYMNILQKVLKDLHGTICVVVDKDYNDSKNFLADGIWLKDPIEFGKLFLQSKSYSESKLTSFADLFETMLDYDGITVVDNMGRIRAYNVFIESSAKVAKNVLGGARKRAAYTLLEGKNKKIIGVYFQSQDGDNFYKETATYKLKKKTKSELVKSEISKEEKVHDEPKQTVIENKPTTTTENKQN
ncbi:MAG: hypothetical protein PHP83_01040 [Clostridia bacterium]|nr:hypothetical protein [Clostridia bacterium]